MTLVYRRKSMFNHVTVLLNEAVEGLNVKSDGIYVIIYVMKPFRAQSYVSMACWKPVSALSLAAAASM